MMDIQIPLICIFIFFSLIISFFDILTFHISLVANYICLFLNIVISILFSTIKESWYGTLNHILGAICLFLLFILIRILTHRQLGLGDLHYSINCGFICGVPGFLFSSIMASLFGMLGFLLILIVKGNLEIKKQRIPFTPFMFAGSMVYIVLELNGIRLF